MFNMYNIHGKYVVFISPVETFDLFYWVPDAPVLIAGRTCPFFSSMSIIKKLNMR